MIHTMTYYVTYKRVFSYIPRTIGQNGQNSVYASFPPLGVRTL